MQTIQDIIKVFESDYKVDLIETPCFAGKTVETHVFELNKTTEFVKAIQEKHPDGIYLMNILPKVPLTGCDLWYVLNDLGGSRFAYLRYIAK